MTRCPACNYQLVRWGGRPMCPNPQCTTSPLEPVDRDDRRQLRLELTGDDHDRGAA